MADEALEHKKAILENSKTIKELTKSIDDLKKSSIGGSGSGDGGSDSDSGSAGPIGRKFDSMVDSLKGALESNVTIKLLTDPAQMLGNAFKGLMSPFESAFSSIKDVLNKPFQALGDLLGPQKAAKKQTELLESIDERLAILTSGTGFLGQIIPEDSVIGMSKDDFGGAIGEASGRQLIKFSESQQKVLSPLANFTTSIKLLPQMIAGKAFNVVSKAFKPLQGITKALGMPGANDDTEVVDVINLSRFEHENGVSVVENGLKNINFTLQDFINMFGGYLRVIYGQKDLPSPKQLALENAKATGREIKRIEDGKDQAQREEQRDNKRFQFNLFKGLGNSIKAALGMGGRGGKDPRKPSKSGIFDWIKKNILGIGVGGAAVAKVASGGIFFGFIKGLVRSFAYLAKVFPIVAKGTLTLGLMTLPLFAFGGAIFALKKALDGFSFEMIGLLGTLVAGVTAAAFGLGLLVSGPQAIVFAAGLAALVGLGATIGLFGAGVGLGEKGFKVVTEFLEKMGSIDNLSESIGALGGLGAALAKVGGGGLLSRFSMGPLDKVGKFLDKIRGNTLPSTALGINNLALGISALERLTISDNFTKSFSKLASKDFQDNLEKAGDGITTLIKRIGSELDGINEGVLDKLTSLVDNGAQLSSANFGGFDIAAAGGYNGPPVIYNVDNSTVTGGQSLTVTQESGHPLGDEATLYVG